MVTATTGQIPQQHELHNTCKKVVNVFSGHENIGIVHDSALYGT
jgi:hemin uptake protein HemP